MDRSRLTIATALLPLILASLQPAWPQTNTKGEANQLKLGELLLTEPVLISLEGAPSTGDDNAKVVIVEFTDYQCPYCGVHASQVLPQIVKDYIATGKIKYVLRDSPAEQTHPLAEKAAEAARCAGDQGKFWEMHERLLSHQELLATSKLPEHAQAIGLNLEALQACVAGGKYTARVRQDFDEGRQAGVKATPSFFLGEFEPHAGAAKALSMVVGALPYAAFKAAIDKMLSPEKAAAGHAEDTPGDLGRKRGYPRGLTTNEATQRP